LENICKIYEILQIFLKNTTLFLKNMYICSTYFLNIHVYLIYIFKKHRINFYKICVVYINETNILFIFYKNIYGYTIDISKIYVFSFYFSIYIYQKHAHDLFYIYLLFVIFSKTHILLKNIKMCIKYTFKKWSRNLLPQTTKT